MHVLKKIKIDLEWRTWELTIGCIEAKFCHKSAGVLKKFQLVFFADLLKTFRFVIVSHAHFNQSLPNFMHWWSHASRLCINQNLSELMWPFTRYKLFCFWGAPYWWYCNVLHQILYVQSTPTNIKVLCWLDEKKNYFKVHFSNS